MLGKLGVVITFVLLVVTGAFVWMNVDVEGAILQVKWLGNTYQSPPVPPWMLITVSLFVGALLHWSVGSGRENALENRLVEREAELQQTKEQLHKIEDVLLTMLPKPVEDVSLEGHEELRPPEDLPLQERPPEEIA